MADKIIVLDFGSQYNQLIARRIREFGVFSQLEPHTISAQDILKFGDVKGIVFQVDQIVFTKKMLLNATQKFLISECLF